MESQNPPSWSACGKWNSTRSRQFMTGGFFCFQTVEAASSCLCEAKPLPLREAVLLVWSGLRGSNPLPSPRTSDFKSPPAMTVEAASSCLCKTKPLPAREAALFVWSGLRGSNPLPSPRESCGFRGDPVPLDFKSHPAMTVEAASSCLYKAKTASLAGSGFCLFGVGDEARTRYCHPEKAAAFAGTPYLLISNRLRR